MPTGWFCSQSLSIVFQYRRILISKAQFLDTGITDATGTPCGRCSCRVGHFAFFYPSNLPVPQIARDSVGFPCRRRHGCRISCDQNRTKQGIKPVNGPPCTKLQTSTSKVELSMFERTEVAIGRKANYLAKRRRGSLAAQSISILHPQDSTDNWQSGAHVISRSYVWTARSRIGWRVIGHWVSVHLPVFPGSHKARLVLQDGRRCRRVLLGGFVSTSCCPHQRAGCQTGFQSRSGWPRQDSRRSSSQSPRRPSRPNFPEYRTRWHAGR